MAGNEVRIKTTVSGNAKQEIGGLRDAWKKFQQEGAKGAAIGVGIAATTKAFSLLGSAASAAGDFIGDSIEAASNMNETLAKSEVVFADNADEVEAWGETAASAFGTSKNAAISAASGFGDLFNKVGLGAEETQKMSTSLVELAADLASFNNLAGGSEEALEKIRSGLAGETEPLRSLGVFLNEAKVKAKAAELGLVSLNGELSEGAKIQARYALIMEETASAQGDFARTSEGLANQQRILNAELENAQAELGEKFLPIQLEVTKAQIDFIEGLELVAGAVDTAGTHIGNLANDMTTLLDVLTFWDEQTHFFATVRIPEQNRALYDAGAAAESIGVDARDARQAIGDMGDEMGETEDAAEALEDALDDLRDAAEDAAAAFGEQKFSATELAGRMSELEQEIIDAKKELGELKAIKDPTAEQRRDIAATRGDIAGMEHDLFETRVELALLNGTGLDKLYKELGAAQYRTDALGDSARTALALFQKLSFASKNVPGFRGDPGFGRADGGPVYPGETYRVGEKGPETLVMGSSGGYVIANGGMGGGTKTSSGGGWSGGVVTVNVNVSGVMTPATAQALRDELVPVLAPVFARKS